MSIRKFRRVNPEEVEFVRYDGTNDSEIEDFTYGEIRRNQITDKLLGLLTYQGFFTLSIGDWIGKDSEEKLFQYDESVFLKEFVPFSYDDQCRCKDY